MIKRKVEVNDGIPKPDFRVVMTASTKGGKTHTMMEFMRKHWKKHFEDNIFVFTGSKDVDKEYKGFNIPDENVFENYDEEICRAIMREQKEAIQEHGHENVEDVLVIFDDMINELPTGKKSQFSKLFTAGRHFNISVCVLSQDYTSVNSVARKNCSHLFFWTANLQDLETILKEQPFPKERFMRAYRAATSKQFGYLLFDRVHKDLFIGMKSTLKRVPE